MVTQLVVSFSGGAIAVIDYSNLTLSGSNFTKNIADERMATIYTDIRNCGPSNRNKNVLNFKKYTTNKNINFIQSMSI